jgi:hypothetical protein
MTGGSPATTGQGRVFGLVFVASGIGFVVLGNCMGLIAANMMGAPVP